MNKLLNLVFAVLVFNSCGSSQSGDGVTSSPDQKNVSSTATGKQTSVSSLYLDKEADLPACDADHNRMLAYIKESKVFKACSGGLWSAVDIKGADGKDGLAGAKGDTGATGATGVKGDPGATGATGTAGTVVNGNMWYDTISKKYWLIPSVEKTASIANRDQQCGDSSSNYRLPNYTELQAAIGRGLKTSADAITAPKETWIQDDGSSAPGVAWTDLGSGVKVSEQYVRSGNVIDGSAGYYCIQK